MLRSPLASSPSSVIGLFGDGGRYGDEQHRRIIKDFESSYGQESDFQVLLDLGYTDLRNRELDGGLQTMNERIQFYRNTATACIVSAVLLVGFEFSDRPGVPLWPWLPLLGMTFLAFVSQFRRIWTHVGDYAIRGVRTLDDGGE